MDDIENSDAAPNLPRRGRKADDPRMIGGWKIGRTIGKGSSGRVKIARHSKTGGYAAIKIVSKTSLVNSRLSLRDLGDEADRILLSIEREIVIMKLIEHPNIMRLYDVWETSGELYLILEYVEGGELFDYLCDKGRLPASEALNYFQQITCAIDYCHRFNIAHRDLKPENLLLDSKNNIKVADFGMAAWQGTGEEDMLETACGSPHYAAPEVIRGEPYDGTSSDIWSCGVILFALLAGRLPFDDPNIHKLLEKVKVAKYTMPADIDLGAQDLITKMLEKDVAKRITMQAILVHPWYTSQAPSGTQHPPPSLDEIARPVPSASEIDADIFGNLRTLWHGAPDEDIIEGLTNAKPTWEKGVYHLLIKYRNKHLENYNGEEDDNPRPHKHSTRPRTAMNPPPVPLSSQARPDPPTPRRAQRRNHSPPSKMNNTEGPPLSPLLPQVKLHSPAGLLPSVSPPIPLTRQPSNVPDSSQALVSPLSPVWDALDLPPLNVPELQDENVQRFFQQIVEHLNVMQLRSSIISGSSTSGTPNVNASPSPGDMRGYQPSRHPVGGNATAPPTPPALSEISQYGDFLIVEHPEMEEMTGASGNSALTNNGDVLSHAETLGLGFSALSGPQGPQPIRPAPRPPLQAKRGSNDKEKLNAGTGTCENGMLHSGQGVTKKSSLRSNDDNTRRAALADKKVRIMFAPEHDHAKSPNRTSEDPFSPTLSDDSNFLPSSSPRRSWFGNLFKFKGAVYHLLSTHDAMTSREECHRLLIGLGVRIVLTESEGFVVLKCKLDEIRDPAGVMAVAKAVQFRVEMQAPSASQSTAGYVVSLTMIQEKGALSSFKLVYNRLRREWDMDAPLTPLPFASPALTTGGRFAEMLHPV